MIRIFKRANPRSEYCKNKEEQTLDYLARLLSSAKNQGFPAHSVTLGDTMGCAMPKAIQSLIKRAKIHWPDVLIRGHLHPRPATEEKCILAAMEAGVDFCEASWCGLGGSPPLQIRPGVIWTFASLLEFTIHTILSIVLMKKLSIELFTFLENIRKEIYRIFSCDLYFIIGYDQRVNMSQLK